MPPGRAGTLFLPVSTKEKYVIFFSFPSTTSWKSSVRKSGTCRPLESVTTASTCTRLTFTRIAGYAAVCSPQHSAIPISPDNQTMRALPVILPVYIRFRTATVRTSRVKFLCSAVVTKNRLAGNSACPTWDRRFRLSTSQSQRVFLRSRASAVISCPPPSATAASPSTSPEPATGN